MFRTVQRGRLVVAALAVVLAGAWGCGKVSPAVAGDAGSGADAGTDNALTVEEGCHRTSEALCDALNDCAAPWVQFLYGDKNTCVMRALRSCMDEQAASGVTRTARDLADCAQALASAPCSELLASKFPSVCLVKPGTVVNGVACGTDWQCQSTYCAKRDSDCGVCGPRAAAGGTCMADAGCQQGMVCASNKCVVPADVSADCNANQPCRSDLYCTGAGKCAARLGPAGSCGDAFFTACDIFHGYFCNLQGSCEAVSVSKGGEACGGGSRTVCMGLNPCQNNVCAFPAGDGEACGNAANANGRNCVPPATCVNGLCRLPSAPSCR